MKTLITAVFATVLVAGCATRKKVLSMPADAGEEKTFPVTLEQAREASRNAVGELGFRVLYDRPFTEHTAEMWVVFGSQGLSANTVGRYARVVIDPRSKPLSVRAIVVSKQASPEAAVTDNALAAELHAKIAGRLKK